MFARCKDSFIVDLDNPDPSSAGSLAAAQPVSCLEYDATIPARFMLGTARGRIISCSRKARVPGDTITARFRGHHGAVRGLQRNPAFSKYFLRCEHQIFSLCTLQSGAAQCGGLELVSVGGGRGGEPPADRQHRHHQADPHLLEPHQVTTLYSLSFFFIFTLLIV